MDKLFSLILSREEVVTIRKTFEGLYGTSFTLLSISTDVEDDRMYLYYRCKKCGAIGKCEYLSSIPKCLTCEKIERIKKKYCSDSYELVSLSESKVYNTVTGTMNSVDNLEFIHKKCGTSIYSSLSELANGHPICPSCTQKGEYSVIQLLKRSIPGISIVTQKKFSFLGCMSLDIFLPDYDIGIEIQGRQHFSDVDRNGKKSFYHSTPEKDIEKINLCMSNGVVLLHFIHQSEMIGIPYTFNGYILYDTVTIIQKVKELIHIHDVKLKLLQK